MKQAFLLLILSSVLASASDWTILESTSKIDGAKRISIIKQSTDHDASLVIRLNDSALDVYMNFDGRFEYAEGHQQIVRVKLDENPPSRQMWTEARRGDAIFPRSPIQFISALAKAKDFLIEVHPFGRIPETISFQVEGLQPKLDSSGISGYIAARQKIEREVALRRLRERIAEERRIKANEQEAARKGRADQDEAAVKERITRAQHEQMLKYCSGFEAYDRPSNCPAN